MEMPNLSISTKEHKKIKQAKNTMWMFIILCIIPLSLMLLAIAKHDLLSAIQFAVMGSLMVSLTALNYVDYSILRLKEELNQKLEEKVNAKNH